MTSSYDKYEQIDDKHVPYAGELESCVLHRYLRSTIDS